jgi:hypothetical protein
MAKDPPTKAAHNRPPIVRPDQVVPGRRSFTFLLDNALRANLEANAKRYRRSLAGEIEWQLTIALLRPQVSELLAPIMEVTADPAPSPLAKQAAAALIRWLRSAAPGTEVHTAYAQLQEEVASVPKMLKWLEGKK